MSVKYINQKEYESTILKIKSTEGEGVHGHWKNYKKRWKYHSKAIEVIKRNPPDNPSEVLEMGTMGISLVNGSHTIDYSDKWNIENFTPTYVHDARKIPWPIKNKQYKWFIALRVFHHLAPKQKQCFYEACRIAENVIIVVPYKGRHKNKINRKNISIYDFYKWNNNTGPKLLESVISRNYLYYWSPEFIKNN